MTTTLRIEGWKAEGLRCPDHELSFLKRGDDTFPITLIQMPNGTGKTTTLTLLRAAFSGEAADGQWSASDIRSFRKQEGEAERGTFQLRLIHNDRRVTVTMSFDFEDGVVHYSTTVGSGMEKG